MKKKAGRPSLYTKALAAKTCRRPAGACRRPGTAPAGTRSGDSVISTGIGSLIQPGRIVLYPCTFFSTIRLNTRRVTGQIATQIPNRSA